MIPQPQPRIEKFESMAFGMFIHWGLYSQLGIGEWAQHIRKIPMTEYKKLKDSFTAEDFDPIAIAKLAKKTGIKYITLTTRHHEGFSLYDTRGLSDFDVMTSPVGRDLIAEFVDACRAEDIMPVFYHTTLDWHQESFENDFDTYLEYLRKSVEILCTHYGKIGGFWFDGNWSKPDADWKLDDLYGTIRRLQPEALIINNTGIHQKGDFGHEEVDSVTYEQGLPTPIERSGMDKYVAGEMCQTMNDHWGSGNNDFNYKSIGELIENLCLCRKVGANYLLNIGPKAQGGMHKMQEAMLEILGEWMRLNGKAIYEGRPSQISGQGKEFALESKEEKVFLFVFDLKIQGDYHVTTEIEESNRRYFSNVRHKIKSAKWLDSGEGLTFIQNLETGELQINTEGYMYGDNLVVRIIELEKE